MFDYVKDKEFLGLMRRECSDVVNRLVTSINNDNFMQVEMHLVGSGAKHLETQNNNEPIDLDYNIVIKKFYGNDINDCRTIKDYIIKMFNVALKSKGWGNCKDSTSAISTEYRFFTKIANKTNFSIDLGIVIESNNTWYRLIHQKTGFIQNDRYFWNEGPNSNGLSKKVNWLKKKGYWQNVRNVYLEKKNLYLSRGDKNHPSFNCYIEAVNQVYYAYNK